MAMDPEELVTLTDHGIMKLRSAVARAMMLPAKERSQPAIAHLITSLEQRNIRILGIEGLDAAHLTTSMPPLLTGGGHYLLAQNEPKKPEAKPKPISLLLDSPVRSGQSIFSEGDVTVLGSVASGAEIVAAGLFMGRFAAARWRVPAATLQLGSSVKRLKPSCCPSTATTRRRKK